MDFSTATRTIVRNALCAHKEEAASVKQICLLFNADNCKGCPYFTTESLKEALQTVYDYYTPQELQKKIAAESEEK